MIVQKDFLNKLKDLGLNSYEAKLWTALLSKGISTAGELSDIAAVPRSRSYDVLESLEKKGFIIMKIGKPIKYIAVPPDEVLARVKRKIEEEAEHQNSMIDKMKDSTVLDELKLLHSSGSNHIEPVDLSGALKGRNNIYNHISSMIKNAKKSVVIATTADGLNRKGDHLMSEIRKARDRGVKVQIVAPITKQNSKTAKELAKYAEVRHTEGNARFCILDGEQLVFMLADDAKTDRTYDAGIWVNTSYFVGHFQNLFDEAWKGLERLK